MRRFASRLLISLIALGLLISGLAGAYSYGQDYYLHRGFVTTARLPRAGRGRLLSVNFYSPALGRRAYYLAYLPAGYTTSRSYPVFYLLHGMPGRPQVWIDIANMDVRLDNQLSQGRMRPMILVFPDGRIGGSTYSDSEWANTRSGRYESYVLEVVKDVERRFAALRDRRDRVIAGFSAGAYGALNIALHNLGVFGSVQVWSGYFSQTRTGVFAHATRAQVVYDSPIDYVGAVRDGLRRDPLRVFMFVGRDDESSRQIVPMAHALGAAGASVSYAIYPGGHDWQVWYPRLNQMLIQASQDFGRPPPAPGTTPLLLAPRTVARPRQAAVALHAHRRRARANGHRRARASDQRGNRHAIRTRPAVPRALRGRRRAPATAAPLLASSRPHAAAGRFAPRHAHEPGPLLLGLLLALASATTINLGFLLQHRGLVGSPSPGRNPLVLLRSRSWVCGQAVGWLGFAAQIVAVGLAPLSLVQAFAAGGLALSVPLAACVFRHRVSQDQTLAVLVIAVSLASLPLGLPGARGDTRTGLLVSSALIGAVLAVALATRRHALQRAVAAGVFYGIADAAIKADSLSLSAHGPGALLSGWTVLALLGTFAGFLAFQAALRAGNAVSAISAMTAVTALSALGFGLAAFGESLGATAPIVFVHLAAISLVLASVPLLAGAQQEIAEADAAPKGRSAARALLATARIIGFTAALVLCLLCGLGLLYLLRGARIVAIGSPVSDSLPLLQLAGFDAEPLLPIAVAWLAAGIILGLVPLRIDPLRRALAAGSLGLVLLLLASDAAFALARNLRFSHALWHRTPGLGPWLEALLFAAGAALPGLLVRVRPALSSRLFATRVDISSRPA